jgi:hypothetical protein
MDFHSLTTAASAAPQRTSALSGSIQPSRQPCAIGRRPHVDRVRCHLGYWCISAKNSLVTADANLLEEAFEQKLSGLPSPAVTTPRGARVPRQSWPPHGELKASKAGSDLPRDIDKSVLAVAAPRRYRNREHLRYVTQQACLVCGRKPSDPHHLRHVQPRALGRRASDEFAVPLCRVHHRAVHRAGDEGAWWQPAGVDPIKIARQLWDDTRANEGWMAQTANQIPHR